MSEEAYRNGIRKGMALRRAVRLCKNAEILPPHPDRYEHAMGALLRQTLPYSPLIETGDADGHLFMDVSGTARLFGPPVDVAWRLRRQVKKDLGLDPIWSVGPNKLVAKVATRLVKPDGEYIVGAGEEKSLLAPLPIGLVPGIEVADLHRLREFNLTRVFQLTALSLEQLQIPFGTRALLLYEAARGIDPSPVLPVGQTPPKVIADHEFGNDTNNISVLERVLYGLGIRRIRRLAVKPATANDLTLFALAWRTLLLAWTRRVRIRHVRLICDRLTFPPAQLDLFAAERKKKKDRDNLILAIDDIRNRFGREAVRFGRSLAA
jgi:DNA polymerase-4